MSNYEEAFELTGHGKFNHIILMSSTLIFLHTMIESVGIAYVITGAECDLKLSVNQKGIVNAATFIGIIVTAIPWGSISDAYGRRSVMLPAVFATIVISFVSALTTSFWPLVILRFVVGCVVSASSATVLVYLGEMHTSAHRDLAIARTIAIVAFSFIIIPAVAWGIVPGRWSFRLGPVTVKPWRVFMWTWALPGLVGAGMLAFLPESPRYTLAARGAVFTMPIVAKMYAINHKTTPDHFPIESITTSTTVLHKGASNMLGDVVQLLTPPLLRCVLLSHYCLFIVFLLANGLYIWLPDLVNEIMMNFGSRRTICNIIVDKHTHEVETTECEGDLAIFDKLMFPTLMAVEATFFLFFVLIVMTIDKYDKTKIYAVLMVPLGISLVISSLVPHAGLAGLFLSLGLGCGGAASLLTALAIYVFPTSLRALSMCTMYMAGQIGASIGSNLLGICVSGHCVVVFIIIAIATIGSALSLLFLWPDAEKVREEMMCTEKISCFWNKNLVIPTMFFVVYVTYTHILVLLETMIAIIINKYLWTLHTAKQLGLCNGY